MQPDPVLIPPNLVSSSDEDIAEIYRQHWPQIRTRFSRQNRLQDWYNFRLSTISLASLREQLSRIFADQPIVFKVNFALGFILRNTETGTLQYHHPSANNNLVLEQPFLVANAEDLDRLYEEIRNIDYLEWVRQQRPNSKWVVDLVTNVTWFVWKIRDHPIGRGKYELEEKLNAYIQELPVLGFNSGKYDLNATKEFLFPYLIEKQPIKFTVKRNSNHMCLKTDFLKFLDISNYLAPGFSYDQFLKAYECEQTKGFFPYEWLDCLDKLEETSLPPHAAFYSSMKNANITDEEYAYCQQVWEDNQMATFKDFLV